VRAHCRLKIFNAGDKSYFKRPPCVPAKMSCRIAVVTRNYTYHSCSNQQTRDKQTSYRLSTFKLPPCPSLLIAPSVARSSTTVGDVLSSESWRANQLKLIRRKCMAFVCCLFCNRLLIARPSRIARIFRTPRRFQPVSTLLSITARTLHISS